VPHRRLHAAQLIQLWARSCLQARLRRHRF